MERLFYYIKQSLLILSVVYFYGLSIALTFHLSAHGFDSPIVFAIMGIAFLVALLIEAASTWWYRRGRIMWALLAIVSYAVLGFFVAPRLYGTLAVWVALLAPLVVVFVGGFLYSYARIFHRFFFSSMKLTIDEIHAALRNLPGWDYIAGNLEKTFRFSGFGQALEFVTKVGVIAQRMHHAPDIDLRERNVKVLLTTRDQSGVTASDIEMAKEIDRV